MPSGHEAFGGPGSLGLHDSSCFWQLKVSRRCCKSSACTWDNPTALWIDCVEENNAVIDRPQSALVVTMRATPSDVADTVTIRPVTKQLCARGAEAPRRPCYLSLKMYMMYMGKDGPSTGNTQVR